MLLSTPLTRYDVTFSTSGAGSRLVCVSPCATGIVSRLLGKGVLSPSWHVLATPNPMMRLRHTWSSGACLSGGYRCSIHTGKRPVAADFGERDSEARFLFPIAARMSRHEWSVHPIPGGLRKARNRAGGSFSAPVTRQISKTTNRTDKRETTSDSSLKGP